VDRTRKGVGILVGSVVSVLVSSSISAGSCAAGLFILRPGMRMAMRVRGVGADAGCCVTSGNAVGVAADSGDNAGALAASGGVVGLIL